MSPDFKLPKKPSIKKVEPVTDREETLSPPSWVYPVGYPDSNFSWNFTPFPLAFSLIPSRAIADKRLSRNDLRTLGALCCYTSKLGICYPNQSTLSNKTGTSRPNISKAIARLSRFGYLRYLEPKGNKFKRAARRGNRYQVLIRGNELLPSNKESLIKN
jgi:DNA-binding MarR family transcriptional regulator